MGERPDIFITNFNRNFTGVSATAAAVTRQMAKSMNLRLVGHPLPGCPDPITYRRALALSRLRPDGRPFAIWHVRRNNEMSAALFARDILRLPIHILFTSAAQRRHSAFPRWLISRMDAVIATTDAAARFVPHLSAVVPHGVDTEVFHPATDRRALWRDLQMPGDYGIATIGRIRPEKGTDLFVAAMIEALPQLPGATALIIGRAARDHAKFAADLKARIAANGLSDRILFLGEVIPADLPTLMRSLSLLVALPRYEGYGMTPLEAMSSGVAFVGSDVGHFREFAGGVAGQIIASADPRAAAAEIVRLLSDNVQLAAMSKTARSRAEILFSVRQEAEGIAQVYTALWAEGHRR